MWIRTHFGWMERMTIIWNVSPGSIVCFLSPVLIRGKLVLGHVMQMLQLNVQMVHVSQISRIVHVLRNFHMPVCLFSDVTDRL